ncbi:MAG: ribonuclease P protein component [Candidatus Celaenobacter antarcticus]|nr:ribonuclease P protein component [Candidatus Celaenobacter antarcticus]MDP8314487.1 ribonuclease P protein component [Candidatus Celaenobacter antarcticus]
MKRITSQAEFDQLRKHGIRKRTRYFDLVSCAVDKGNDFGLAVIVSKKVANAVKRNKIKRWIKNFAYTHIDLFHINNNYLVIAKRGIYEFGHDNIYNELENVLEECE